MAKGTRTPTKVQHQREEAARIAAEKALTAKSAERTATPEPTLEERLSNIDRRAKERAADEKKQLALEYLSDAKLAFKRAVSNTADETVKTAWEELQRLEKLVEASGGQASGDVASPLRGKRRTKQDMQADAQKIISFLRSNPNSSGADIRAVAEYGISLGDFIKKYGDGSKLHKEGSTTSMTYSIA